MRATARVRLVNDDPYEDRFDWILVMDGHDVAVSVDDYETADLAALAAQQVTTNPVGVRMQQADIDNRFTYHTPKLGQSEIYSDVRARAKGLVEFLADSCPASRELSLAVTHIEEAVFWANASIARHSVV